MDKNSYLLTVDIGGMVWFDIEPSNSQHQHGYFEICLVTSGTGEYLDGGHVFPLSPGVLFASRPNVVHEIRSVQTRDLGLFFVAFNVREIASGAGNEIDRVLSRFMTSSAIWVEQCQSLLPYVGLIEGASTDFIRAELARLFTIEAMNQLVQTESTGIPGKNMAPEILVALTYIETHCDNRLTVSEVANHVGLAPRTLMRRFLTHVGHGVGVEIRQRKMRRAAHRLLMGYSVQEVGRSVGIEDASQFSRAFFEVIGSRPKAFQSSYAPGSLSKQTIFTKPKTVD